MIKNLTKHGNSYALVIDKAILELLRITPEEPLEITTDGSALTIRPVAEKGRTARFEKTLKQINRRHSRALKRLAE